MTERRWETSVRICGSLYLQRWGGEPWKPYLMTEPVPGPAELVGPPHQNQIPPPSPAGAGQENLFYETTDEVLRLLLITMTL